MTVKQLSDVLAALVAEGKGGMPVYSSGEDGYFELPSSQVRVTDVAVGDDEDNLVDVLLIEVV